MNLSPFKPYVPNRSETAQKAATRWFMWCAVGFTAVTIILSVRSSPPAKAWEAYFIFTLSAALAGVCWLLVWMCRTNRITAAWADDDESDDDA